MTKTIAATELKARLSEILSDVERGESIGITRHGKTIARLVSPEDDDRDSRLRAGITVEDILSARDEGRK
jgi:prevent-host-death family protein